ncbi:hypothetical protein [Acidithiobacillus ferrianus]|uniref:hypothetical protein n=1 Tax=Acidithiobacillus ferrianus TaxID=2678518 RepID=UPI0034E488BE
MAATGDTAQQDIAREFSGALTTNNNGANPIAAPTNCNTALQQEQAAGQISANESCYCQVGATTPTCVQNAASTCQSILPAEESRLGPNAKYYDCTCPSGASTPSCPSYYQLCQDNLQYYQNTTNQCSCANPSTTAVPTCVSDYSICENNAAQYENSNTTCSCSQTNTAPTCCTSTTTQNCSTTQQCTTTQQCQQVVTGYSCPATNSNGTPFTFMQCHSGSTEVHQTTEPLSYCGYAPTCGYATYVILYTQTAGYTYSQQCTPVTTCTPVQTCTPVTTQSCATE